MATRWFELYDWDYETMTPAERDDLTAWLRTLNLDPNKIWYKLAVLISADDGERYLHCTRYLTDEDGGYYISDWAQSTIASEPVVLRVDTLPAFATATPVMRAG